MLTYLQMCTYTGQGNSDVGGFVVPPENGHPGSWEVRSCEKGVPPEFRITFKGRHKPHPQG